MKKIILVLLSVLLLTSRVYAVTAEDKKVYLSDYKTLNFKQILSKEGIKEEFKNYSEDDTQVVIYMFRGDGCGYCKSFLSFLNSITNEYGKYFRVVGFEVWSDQENSKLLDKLSSFMDSKASGVPYIIIGDKVFPGYAESYNEGILSAIQNQYNSNERYDVFKEYNLAIDRAKRAASGNAGAIIFWNFVMITCAVVIVLYYNKKQYKDIIARLDNKEKVVEVVDKKDKIVEIKDKKEKEVKRVKNAKKKKK